MYCLEERQCTDCISSQVTVGSVICDIVLGCNIVYWTVVHCAVLTVSVMSKIYRCFMIHGLSFLVGSYIFP